VERVKWKPFTQDVLCKGCDMFQVITQDVLCKGCDMFQVPSSLLPVCTLIFGEKSQKIAQTRFESYNSIANFSIFENSNFSDQYSDGMIRTSAPIIPIRRLPGDSAP